MSEQYAVIGYPISHSLSPRIHSAFGRACGIELTYRPILSLPDKFSSQVEMFRASGGRGLNVTIPFKVEAFHFATALTLRAQEAKAVNTLTLSGIQSVGDNTDGVGFIRDLELNARFSVEGKRVLILGAGGAARGILGPLADARPSGIWLSNRTPERAIDLAGSRSGVYVLPFDSLAGHEFDLVINASSSSLEGSDIAIPKGLFATGSLACDLMYARSASAWMIAAHHAGAAQIRDGLGMLIEQAAESFFVWHQIRPQTAPLLVQFAKELPCRDENGGWIPEEG